MSNCVWRIFSTKGLPSTPLPPLPWQIFLPKDLAEWAFKGQIGLLSQALGCWSPPAPSFRLKRPKNVSYSVPKWLLSYYKMVIVSYCHSLFPFCVELVQPHLFGGTTLNVVIILHLGCLIWAQTVGDDWNMKTQHASHIPQTFLFAEVTLVTLPLCRPFLPSENTKANRKYKWSWWPCHFV